MAHRPAAFTRGLAGVHGSGRSGTCSKEVAELTVMQKQRKTSEDVAEVKADNSDRLILDHYREQAVEHQSSPASTMLDEIVRERETEAILRFLDRAGEGRLLEIGCGNGFLLEAISTRFGRKFELHGIDLTPELLALAQARRLDCALQLGDVRCLPCDAGFFDVVVSERAIINILDPNGQMKAFENVARVLKPGGQMVAIEGFKTGLENLNRARADFLLSPIPEPAFNNWFTEERWEGFLTNGFREFTEAESGGLAPANFLSSHYFITRCLHDVIKPAGGKVRNTELARFFAAALPPAGDYSPLRIKYIRRVAAALDED